MAANEALARVATLGLLPNMILYLMGNYNLHLGKATKILLLSVATTNFMPLPGAFISDSYLGRFLAVGLGSFITFLVSISYSFSLTTITMSCHSLNLTSIYFIMNTILAFQFPFLFWGKNHSVHWVTRHSN